MIKQRQGTEDIINEILKTHRLYETDYDKIYPLFDTGNIDSTSRGIWEFLKYNLRYNAESGSDQSVKSPTAILHPGENIDCKHFSLFAGGVLDAIKQNEGEDWDWNYRFVSYDKNNASPGHVFVVVNDGNKEIWIDPVLDNYNQKKSYYHFIDETIMPLYSISGTNDPVINNPTISVDAQLAKTNFLVLLGLDCLSLKDLFLSNPDITNGPFKQYCIDNGIDFNTFTALLNA